MDLAELDVVTSLPASRDAPRRETNLRFRHLESLPHNGKFTRDNYTVDRFVDAIKRHFSYPFLFNLSYKSFFKIQST
jgi:hypothetical protein